MASKLHHYVCFLTSRKGVSVINTKSKGREEMTWEIVRGGVNEKNGIWAIKLIVCLHGFEINLPYPDQAVVLYEAKISSMVGGVEGRSEEVNFLTWFQGEDLQE